MNGSTQLGPRHLLGLAACGVLLLALLQAPGASAASKRGQADIVHSGGTSPLDGGGSATPFGVALPGGAACPGDTLHHGELIYSYVVPLGSVPPGQLDFSTNYPNVGTNLVTAAGEPFVTENTKNAAGVISQPLPPFSWSRYDHDPQDLPLGTYNVGIACARVQAHNRTDFYWNTEVVFTASRTDPGGFTWRVVPALRAKASLASSESNRSTWVAVAAVLVVLAAGAGLALSRRARHRRRSSRNLLST